VCVNILISYYIVHQMISEVELTAVADYNSDLPTRLYTVEISEKKV